MISQATHGVYKERPDAKTDHWQRTDCSRQAVQYKSNALKRPGLRWNRLTGTGAAHIIQTVLTNAYRHSPL